MRINIALADETLGDTALENGDADEATAWWQAGIDALAEGGCPTDSGRGQDQTEDAAAVDQRLRDKLQQQQQQQQQDEQQQQQDDEQTPEERREQRQQERKEKRLEERNDDAIEEEQDYEESNRERDYSQYHW